MTYGQQTDVRQELNSKNLVYIEQIANHRISDSARDNFDLITVGDDNKAKPDSVPIQQFVMANLRGVEWQIAPGVLLQRIGDINFINFIQRGDFTPFIFSPSRSGNVVNAYIFNYPSPIHLPGRRFVPRPGRF
ncbi:hypothetical protein [Litoribacter populi]|uniref:hypothetical protein n=1 Tax=Litoribacter populi TaxID=2598460 RepID=UPI00117D75AD|nr:hypothetical protein [Litoribacter populi]